MYELIRKTVESYALPDRIKQKILRIAERNIEKLCLTGFDSQYRYVVDLTERFQVRYEDRFNLSLDAQLEDGSGKTLHEVLEDRNVPNLDTSDIGYSPGMSLYKVFLLVKSFLSEEQRELMLKLMNNSRNGQINLQPEDILTGSLLIRERVDALVRLLEQDTRFRQPERQLIYVNLDGPYARFRKRDYHEDPLNYFRKHNHVYGGMSRTELQDFDPGLYQTLRRRRTKSEGGVVVKQIELAIPNRLIRDFKDNPLAYLVENYGKYVGMSFSDFRKSDRSLYGKLIANDQLNLARRLFGGDYKFLDVHRLCNADSNLAARMLGISDDVVLKRWHRYGLGVSRPIKRRSREEELIITDAHKLFDGNCLSAARHLSLSTSTVWVTWKKYGLQTKTQRGGKLRIQ